MFALVASGIALYNVSFYEPFLSIQIEQFGIADNDMGYFFMMLAGSYFVSCIITPMIKLPPKLMYVICLFFTAAAFGLMGPS